MAASFPFLHSTFLLDSDFLQNTTCIPKMPYGLLMDHDHIINSNNCFNYNNYQPSSHHDEILHHQEMDASRIQHEAAGISSVENNTVIRSPLSTDEQQSMSEYKTTTDSSSMVIQLDENDDDEQEIHKNNTTHDYQKKRRKNRDGSCLISGQSTKDLKETKAKKQRKCNGGLKETDEQKKNKTEKKNQKGVSDEPPTGYIHVRARRGQATDSHSLAERVRREKISERMKLLQSLVPGCDKVTGKALMLDEIINYVQSLQNQVEFLSMKLSSVNHPAVFHDFGAADLDAFMVKSEKMSDLVSPLPSMQQFSTTSSSTAADQLTAFGDNTTTTFTTRHNYPSLEFQQCHRSNAFSSQVNENLLMDVDEQSRQMFINQSWFNHLCSFQ